MHQRIDPSDELLALAVLQTGVLTAEQALGHGLTRGSIKRLVDQQAWRRLARGVFLLGVGEPTWLANAWAGTLIGGEHARLGFDAAGHLWGIVPDPPASITVLVPHQTVISDRAPWTFPRERPGVREARCAEDPPRTSAEDTVLDLCAESTPGELAGILTTAVQTRVTDAARLRRRIDQRARLRHRTLLRAVLAEVADGAESPLELTYLRDVEGRHQLPPARRQHRSRTHGAVRDLRYDTYALLIELDGRLHIPGRFRDLQRDNSALLDGELTLRYGWPDVSDRPCQVAWQVARLLVLRGWTGLPARCDWCAEALEEDLLTP